MREAISHTYAIGKIKKRLSTYRKVQIRMLVYYYRVIARVAKLFRINSTRKVIINSTRLRLVLFQIHY